MRKKTRTALRLVLAAAGAAPAAFLDPRFAPWTGALGFIGAAAFWLVWSRG